LWQLQPTRQWPHSNQSAQQLVAALDARGLHLGFPRLLFSARSKVFCSMIAGTEIVIHSTVGARDIGGAASAAVRGSAVERLAAVVVEAADVGLVAEQPR
jgi:hypothetical protein